MWVRVRNMAQLVYRYTLVFWDTTLDADKGEGYISVGEKHLPCKCKDLSLIPRTHKRMPDAGHSSTCL